MLDLQNRPLPPPPPPNTTSPSFVEPVYSPVSKHHQQRLPSPVEPADLEEEVGYAYVRVQMEHDGGSVPEDPPFRKLPTPPPDDDDEDSESGEAPVEDAPKEVSLQKMISME